MHRKDLWFCAALILMGFLDWLTTMIGVLYFGATETNPLIAGLTQSSMLIFSAVKLSAVSLAGFVFYKAGAMGRNAGQTPCFATMFLDSGYAVSLLALTAFVINNITVLFRLM